MESEYAWLDLLPGKKYLGAQTKKRRLTAICLPTRGSRRSSARSLRRRHHHILSLPSTTLSRTSPFYPVTHIKTSPPSIYPPYSLPKNQPTDGSPPRRLRPLERHQTHPPRTPAHPPLSGVSPPIHHLQRRHQRRVSTRPGGRFPADPRVGRQAVSGLRGDYGVDRGVEGVGWEDPEPDAGDYGSGGAEGEGD